MKYLKTFESSNTDLKDIIEDILVDFDLQDFRVPISYSINYSSENAVKVRFFVKNDNESYVKVNKFFQSRDYNKNILPFIKRMLAHGIYIDSIVTDKVILNRIETSKSGYPFNKETGEYQTGGYGSHALYEEILDINFYLKND